MYVKEKVEEALLGVKQGILKDLRTHAGHLLTFLHDHLHTQKYYTKLCERNMSSVGNKVGSFLSTGNIVTSTGLDLMQVSGYTIVAEKLNYLRYVYVYVYVLYVCICVTHKSLCYPSYFPPRLHSFRYLSHFQSVHRGQFFTTMKTTTVC
ncbi:hypothetical protein EON65_25800 [archaeon]|nr:MAG: hypothetical protein EON65_25800 [archaeon]